MKNGRIEDSLGNIGWWVNGQLHREDGPAFEFADGGLVWMQHDQMHREDGPAIEGVHGEKQWFLNGIEFTEREFNRFLEKKVLKEKLESSFPQKLKIKRRKI